MPEDQLAVRLPPGLVVKMTRLPSSCRIHSVRPKVKSAEVRNGELLDGTEKLAGKKMLAPL